MKGWMALLTRDGVDHPPAGMASFQYLSSPEWVVAASLMLRQAEIRQEALFRAALGMDQRAAVIAGGFAAAAAALGAAGLALKDGAQCFALLTACGFGCSAVFALIACRPQRFRFPGVRPLDWLGAEKLDPPYDADLVVGLLCQHERWIVENEQRQRASGRWLMSALILGLSSAPIVALGLAT